MIIKSVADSNDDVVMKTRFFLEEFLICIVFMKMSVLIIMGAADLGARSECCMNESRQSTLEKSSNDKT